MKWHQVYHSLPCMTTCPSNGSGWQGGYYANNNKEFFKVLTRALQDYPSIKACLYSCVTVVLSLGLLVLGIVFLVKGQSSAGLLSGQLSPCPDTPNCVCSEERLDGSAYIDPLVYQGDSAQAWRWARQAILNSGGVILHESGGYLWAAYSTRWLRFVDDVELRLDQSNDLIHLRSASRVGSYDFHVNRQRVERLRSMFGEMQEGVDPSPDNR